MSLQLLVLSMPAIASTLDVPEQYPSIQAAVDAAADDDVVRVGAGTWSEAVVIDAKRVTIEARERQGATIQGTSATFGAFEIVGASDVTLAGLVLDGQSTNPAMAVSGGSVVTLTDSRVVATSKAGDGGAIEVTGAGTRLTVRRTAAIDSVATGDGGFISASNGAELVVEASSFEAGSAANGGAISCDDATCTIDGGWFELNTASTAGGAVYVGNFGDLSLDRSVFCHNDAITNGGGLRGVDANVSAAGNLFFENTAQHGGGLSTLRSTATVSHATFVGNSTTEQGGAVHGFGSTWTGTYNAYTHSDTHPSQYAVQLNSGTQSIDYALFFANVKDSKQAVGAGVLYADPLYVGYAPGVCDPASVFLLAGSPAIDVGAPGAVDLDGTPADIGFTGGLAAVRDDDADGAFAGLSDCEDDDATRSALAVEVAGDGVDQDCDARELCYVDSDADGVGTATLAWSSDLTCSAAGVAATSGDCDDDDDSRHPGAAEVPADGVDQDCDGDEACYEDADLDGFGSASLVASGALDCSDAGVTAAPGDCDDTDAARSPDAEEIPGNGFDDDCDGLEACFVDADHDGHGSATIQLRADLSCSAAGIAAATGDCDDGDPSVHPSAADVCGDGVDQDCDGAGGPDDDEDGDGLPWALESGIGANDCNPDSDGDGVPDAIEILYDDTDGDLVPNILDTDDDEDGIFTIDEGMDNAEDKPLCVGLVVWDDVPNYLDLDSDGDGKSDALEANKDTDQDSIPDWADCVDDDGCAGDTDGDGIGNCDETDLGLDNGDADTDGDGIPDLEELGSVESPIDTDGDMIYDPADPDDDGDGLLTTAEDHDDDGDPRNDDTDGDGTPDYLDDDDDGDGTPTRLEDRDGDGSFDDDDLDGDLVPDYLDRFDHDGPSGDADSDGLVNSVEEFLGTDPLDPDTDGDGLADGAEVVDPAAPRDTDQDGLIDALDDDDDDDGIPTAQESPGDLDGDGLPNHLDPDSDGDGLADGVEGFADPDCDGIPALQDPNPTDGTCGGAPTGRVIAHSTCATARPAAGFPSLIALLGAALLMRRRAGRLSEAGHTEAR